MKHLILTVLISSSLISCANANKEPKEVQNKLTPINPNGYTEEQIRADWDIPQWPEVTHADYDTVKGVDDEGLTGVRDDWEIMNAIASYPDIKEFNLLNNAAKLNNQMIDAYEENDKDKLIESFNAWLLNLTCYGDYYNDKNDGLIMYTFRDTENRNNHYKKLNKMLEHYIGPIELPSYGELERECPLLMNNSGEKVER
jgi:hypothetical protein